ncbi:site-specific integrase [Ralstonia pseudosolanacearum]|uniref:site-specific integrase n=2 Tax=Ralstonia pseudosolanacearum TaxID=1310165 RepID=UPI0018D15F6D|nr:site-specific integrase [Ralstonia pseudosolanacearum]
MRSEPIRIYKPPQPTLADPYAQIKWMFFQLEAEFAGSTAKRIRYTSKKYLQFVSETDASYSELEQDRRFYLEKYWEADALIRFNKWLLWQPLKSKSRYGIYKTVRQVMDMAYALRVIDTVVYHAPMFKGVSETKQRAAYAEDEQEVINAAVARWIGLANSVLLGYTRTEAGIPHKHRRPFSHELVVGGQTLSVPEAAARFGVPPADISRRLRMSWTPEQAVGIVARPHSGSKGRELCVEGVTYPSIQSAATAYGKARRCVAVLLQQGYTPEQSVGITPIRVLASDDRALLWSFENVYGCDAYAMVEDFRARPRGAICTIQRLLKLFIRWGVWPYVDDRLIMPLAVELSMLTGLNVEALKMLEVDSYQAEHKLTGQPVITYIKRRSASSTRTEDRELHLPMLELEEDLYLEPSVVQRVEKLLGLVLALTAKIRSDAPPEIARRLFIFEDVEDSLRTGRRVVVPVDPRRKTALWYTRFCVDEGLYSLFGESFSFNLARCRPTFATNMVLAGASLFQVQVAMGHESIETTATYLDEQGLRPIFNRTMTEALERISERSREFRENDKHVESPREHAFDNSFDGFHETLSGCGCGDPYNPSQNVRTVTKHVEGSVCRFWNMCLRCDSAVVTEMSLPKFILYRRRLGSALEEDSPSIRGRRQLYEDSITLIDGILKPDVVFPSEIIENAEHLAATMDDVLVDHLIYQGI